jgi:hypothetical protein
MDYIQSLDTIFNDLVMRYNKLQFIEHSEESLQKARTISTEATNVISHIKSHLTAIECLLNDCNIYIAEVEDDLSESPKEDYVFQTKYGMLSYQGRDHISLSKPTYETKKEIKSDVVTTERVLIPDVGYYMRLPIVHKLSQIPPMFYYYKSPDNKDGIYCSILPNVYTKVPFPIITDSTKEYGRDKSIKCKYKSRVLCDEQRSKMAKLHNSQIRTCNFAHTGEKLIKIGYPSRCTSIPNFGNPTSLVNDLRHIDLTAIKTLLMYGLNDIIISSIWLDSTKTKELILDNLDVV